MQVNKVGPEAFLFVKEHASGCLYANGAPPVAFNRGSDTVSLDIRATAVPEQPSWPGVETRFPAPAMVAQAPPGEEGRARVL